MGKYLKVHISGRYGDETHYVELDDREYSDGELHEIAQGCFNNEYSWGVGDVVDENEVPEGER